MCWSHVAHNPDLTHPLPQPAQQPSCLKWLFNIQRVRGNAFCAESQRQDLCVTLWLSLKMELVLIIHKTSVRLPHILALEKSQPPGPLSFQPSGTFWYLSPSNERKFEKYELWNATIIGKWSIIGYKVSLIWVIYKYLPQITTLPDKHVWGWTCMPAMLHGSIKLFKAMSESVWI